MSDSQHAAKVLLTGSTAVKYPVQTSTLEQEVLFDLIWCFCWVHVPYHAVLQSPTRGWFQMFCLHFGELCSH